MRTLLATILIGALLSPYCCCIAQPAETADKPASHSCCDTEAPAEQQQSHDCGCDYVVADIDQNTSISLLPRDNAGKEVVYFDSHEVATNFHTPTRSGYYQSDQLLLWKQDPLYLKHCVFRL